MTSYTALRTLILSNPNTADVESRTALSVHKVLTDFFNSPAPTAIPAAHFRRLGNSILNLLSDCVSSFNQNETRATVRRRRQRHFSAVGVLIEGTESYVPPAPPEPEVVAAPVATPNPEISQQIFSITQSAPFINIATQLQHLSLHDLAGVGAMASVCLDDLRSLNRILLELSLELTQ
jgi:hypothetical protein